MQMSNGLFGCLRNFVNRLRLTQRYIIIYVRNIRNKIIDLSSSWKWIQIFFCFDFEKDGIFFAFQKMTDFFPLKFEKTFLI